MNPDKKVWRLPCYHYTKPMQSPARRNPSRVFLSSFPRCQRTCPLSEDVGQKKTPEFLAPGSSVFSMVIGYFYPPSPSPEDPTIPNILVSSRRKEARRDCAVPLVCLCQYDVFTVIFLVHVRPDHHRIKSDSSLKLCGPMRCAD